MPRYYFHLHERLGVISDKEGAELPGLDDAKARAFEHARHMISEGAKLGAPGLNRMFEVKDAAGETVVTVQFHEAAK